jgi:hypothetical protein
VSRHHRVLARNEAQQMATDIGQAIGNLIGLAAEMTDTDKVFALDTLVLLQIKRNILEGEIAWTDREAAERDLATLQQVAAQKGMVQP